MCGPHTTAHCVLSFSHLAIYEKGMCLAFDGESVQSVANLHVQSNSLGTANRRKTTEEIPKDFVCISVL